MPNLTLRLVAAMLGRALRFPPRRDFAAERGGGGQGLHSNRVAAPQAALRGVAALGTLP